MLVCACDLGGVCRDQRHRLLQLPQWGVEVVQAGANRRSQCWHWLVDGGSTGSRTMPGWHGSFVLVVCTPYLLHPLSAQHHHIAATTHNQQTPPLGQAGARCAPGPDSQGAAAEAAAGGVGGETGAGVFVVW